MKILVKRYAKESMERRPILFKQQKGSRRLKKSIENRGIETFVHHSSIDKRFRRTRRRNLRQVTINVLLLPVRWN